MDVLEKTYGVNMGNDADVAYMVDIGIVILTGVGCDRKESRVGLTPAPLL